MNYIKLIDGKSYLPQNKISNEEIENEFELKKDFIKSRTGIEKRYYAKDEKIEDMAVNAVLQMKNEKINDIGLIIVATTSSNNAMPGISNYIQKKLKIERCMCLDIFAGCGGFINAFDIARLYIETGKIKKALVVGVDKLSSTIDKKDIGTMAVLSDGAGAVLIEKSDVQKEYVSNIESEIDEKSILNYEIGQKIQMNGKEVYKYAVTKPVENIKQLLQKSNEKIEDIKYIIPHQSNLKIMNAIAKKLEIPQSKIYSNIQEVGNTFCASIPIAISEMIDKKILNENDKIILLGYGGGLNTGSILLEI